MTGSDILSSIFISQSSFPLSKSEHESNKIEVQFGVSSVQ